MSKLIDHIKQVGRGLNRLLGGSTEVDQIEPDIPFKKIDPELFKLAREARRREEQARLTMVPVDNSSVTEDHPFDFNPEKERITPKIETVPVPSLQFLRSLTSEIFEDEMAEVFRRLGYEVKQTPYVNDHGRDAIMHKDGKKFLLECKRYAAGRTSGRPELQKFHSAIMTDKADRGFFVTTGGFTTGAKKFAASEPIGLISGETLLKIMAVAARKEGNLSINHLLVPEEARRKARKQSRRWRRY